MTSPDERLATERNCWMATTRPDGRPHLAPLWFVHVDGRVWIGTGAASVRVANLRHDPRASIALEDGGEPMAAEGVVTIHDHERPPAVVEAFATKYAWDITIATDVDVGQVVLLEFVPTKWLFAENAPSS